MTVYSSRSRRRLLDYVLTVTATVLTLVAFVYSVLVWSGEPRAFLTPGIMFLVASALFICVHYINRMGRHIGLFCGVFVALIGLAHLALVAMA